MEGIQRVKEVRFLSVHFDQRRTWNKRIERAVFKCEKVIGSTRAAGQDTQSMIYRAAIRSRLDYDCLRYGTTAPQIGCTASEGTASTLWGLPVHRPRFQLVELCRAGRSSSGSSAIKKKKKGNAVIIKLRRHRGEHPATFILGNALERAGAKRKTFSRRVNKWINDAILIYWSVIYRTVKEKLKYGWENDL